MGKQFFLKARLSFFVLGMVAAIIAIAFLFLLSMCVLLVLKRRKYFSTTKGQPPKPSGNGAATTNGSGGILYTESSGTLYQNEDFYMEIPLKHENGVAAAATANNNNHPTQRSRQPRLEHAPESRKSLTPSGKSSGSSRENIYEEIALASRNRRLSFGAGAAAPTISTPKPKGAANPTLPSSVEEQHEIQSPDDSPALYAKVDFDQKRKSRMIKEQSEGTPQRNPAETSVKLRDLPPIPPPDEDSAESGGGTVAMSLVGAVTPMSSLAPHVVEGGNVYIDHPLAMDPGANDTVMVENKLYAPS